MWAKGAGRSPAPNPSKRGESMTTTTRPNFVDSPYFDIVNWRLLPGAPKEVVREFKAFQRAAKSPEAPTTEEIKKKLADIMPKELKRP